MHYRKAQDPLYMGADDFVDAEMNPIERKLTIARVGMQKPPAGKKEKICIWFREEERGAFFPASQITKIARLLRRAETDLWIGAVLLITSAEVKSVSGGMTSGMRIVNAAFPRSLQQQKPPIQQEPTNVQP